MVFKYFKMGPLIWCATSPLETCFQILYRNDQGSHKINWFKNILKLWFLLSYSARNSVVSSHDNKKIFFPLMPNRFSEKWTNRVWVEERRKGPLETHLYQELKFAALWFWLWIKSRRFLTDTDELLHLSLFDILEPQVVWLTNTTLPERSEHGVCTAVAIVVPFDECTVCWLLCFDFFGGTKFIKISPLLFSQDKAGGGEVEEHPAIILSLLKCCRRCCLGCW